MRYLIISLININKISQKYDKFDKKINYFLKNLIIFEFFKINQYRYYLLFNNFININKIYLISKLF